jgi:hypothetical protein
LIAAAFLAGCQLAGLASPGALMSSPSTSGALPTIRIADAIAAARAAIDAEAARNLDDYCGKFIDLEGSRAFTSLWKSDLDAHAAAVRAAAGDGIALSFRPCTFSLRELEATRAAIGGDAAWLDSIEARLVGARILEPENVIEVSLSTIVPDAIQQIAAQQGVAPEMLRLHQVGYGEMFVPWGALDVTFMGAAGPVPRRSANYDRLELRCTTDRPGLRCGGGAVPAPFSQFSIQEGHWTIRAMARLSSDESVQIGHAVVDVVGDTTTKLTIEIGPIPPERPE